MNKPISQLIYEYRAKNGLSQQELAKRLYISYKSIARYENNNKMPPPIIRYVLEYQEIIPAGYFNLKNMENPAIAYKKDRFGGKANKSACIYIFRCENYFKIGIAKNPFIRLNNMQVGNPFTMKMVMQIFVRNPVEEEKKLHSKFSDKSHRGEWFKLETTDLQYLKDQYTGSFEAE